MVSRASRLLKGSLRPLLLGPTRQGGTSSGLGAPEAADAAGRLMKLQACSPLQEHGPRSVQRFQELGYGWVLKGQEGELSGQAGSLCSLPEPPVTALGLAPCSSSPNEPPAAGRRLK